MVPVCNNHLRALVEFCVPSSTVVIYCTTSAIGTTRLTDNIKSWGLIITITAEVVESRRKNWKILFDSFDSIQQARVITTIYATLLTLTSNSYELESRKKKTFFCPLSLQWLHRTVQIRIVVLTTVTIS